MSRNLSPYSRTIVVFPTCRAPLMRRALFVVDSFQSSNFLIILRFSILPTTFFQCLVCKSTTFFQLNSRLFATFFQGFAGNLATFFQQIYSNYATFCQRMHECSPSPLLRSKANGKFEEGAYGATTLFSGEEIL